jgi:hypothetical protein
MVTYCWTVMRQVAPRIHRHAAHLVHRSGRILHRLPKFAHHPFHPTMLVCRALPLALAGAGLVNITPTEPPNHPVASSAYVQPVQQGQFVPPYQPPGPPPFPSPFACCGVPFPPPNDPGINIPLSPPVSDPGPNGDPPGDPPIITTFVDPGPPPNSVDEPSSGVVVLGALTSLLLFRRARPFRT